MIKGYIVFTPAGCGSKGSVSKLEASYSIFKS